MASVAAPALQGYAIDRDNRVKQALAEQTAARQAENDRIRRQVELAGINPDLQGQIAGARANAGVAPAIAQAKGVAEATAPIDTKKAVDIATQTAPITKQTAIDTHTANRKTDVENPLPVQQSFKDVVTTAPGGDQHVSVLNTKTGEIKDTGANAKAPTSLAKLTEPQEKSYLFYNLMKNAEPDIDSTLASGKVRPAAITAYLRSGPADAVVNALLNDDEQRLIRAARDFTAGVLRKESGAAITHDEIKQTLDRYFPGFGDQGPVGESKAQARKSYMHTMEQEATPAINYYAKQKPQSATAPAADPEFDALMAKYTKKPPT